MHLVVLHHGLWGNPDHLQSVINHLKDCHSDAQLLFLNIQSSSGSLTYDGIDVCGQRVVSDIHQFLVDIPAVDRISFIGYSLGGLILRYAIGKLYSEGFFSKVKPIQFISLATPHVGTLKPPHLVSTRVFNSLQATFLVRVGDQFTLNDRFLHERPLLDVLSSPKYDFYKGLELFQQRVCFANTQYDRSVSYTTGSISYINDYRRYEAQVIDEKYPSIVKVDTTREKEPIPWSTSDYVKAVYLPILLTIWLPIGTSILSYFALSARYKQSQLKLQNDWIKSYDTNISMSKEIENEDVGMEETDGGEEVIPEGRQSINHKDEKSNLRKQIIFQLNQLNWIKVNVKINAFNSHAAIVVRRPSVNGTHSDVLQYLAKEIFIL
ncbi:putative serine esterase-domain-containing protein [Globomyces pollinis-pini]|nr:putative serine esterase-domain-containing protein [Globomyces pollinis-pini]